MKSPFFAWFIGFVLGALGAFALATAGALGVNAVVLSALLAGPGGLALAIAAALSGDCWGSRGHLLMCLAGVCGGVFGMAVGLVCLAYFFLVGVGGPWAFAATVILSFAAAILLTVLPAMVAYAVRKWREERRDSRQG